MQNSLLALRKPIAASKVSCTVSAMNYYLKIVSLKVKDVITEDQRILTESDGHGDVTFDISIEIRIFLAF